MGKGKGAGKNIIKGATQCYKAPSMAGLGKGLTHC